MKFKMFEGYLFDKEHTYEPVANQAEDGLIQQRSRAESKSSRRKTFVQALLVVEAVHLLILLAWYSAVNFASIYISPRHELDSYFDLFDYNTVKTFYGDWTLMNGSAESDALFEDIQESDGVVAIDTEWALRHGYAPSLLHPDDDSKSIYQIDMFHSIHCVYRLRNKLTSHLSLQEWPRDDEHTLHCLDYLREQLMCNADIQLEGTADLLHFDKNNGHTCRNTESVKNWARAHHWQGHRQFLIDTTGYQ